MSAIIKKAYCVGLQDQLAELAAGRGPFSDGPTVAEIKLSRCRDCPTGERNRKELAAMTEKTKKCIKCGEEKNLEQDFRRKKANKDGYDNVCKLCIAKREKQWKSHKKLKKIAEVKLAERRKNKRVPASSKLVPPAIPAPAAVASEPKSFLAEMVSDVVHTAEQATRDGDPKNLVDAAYYASLDLSVKLRALMEKM